MTIDLSLIDDDERIQLDFQEKVKLPPVYNLANDETMVSFYGSLSRRRNVFVLSGKGEATVCFPCDRCLSPVDVKVGFEIADKLTLNPSLVVEGSEVALVADSVFDLSDSVAEGLYSSLPMRVVCGEDCLGLCPKCGHNLNQNDCGCDRTNYNPQFEALRSLLEEKEV